MHACVPACAWLSHLMRMSRDITVTCIDQHGHSIIQNMSSMVYLMFDQGMRVEMKSVVLVIVRTGLNFLNPSLFASHSSTPSTIIHYPCDISHNWSCDPTSIT